MTVARTTAYIALRFTQRLLAVLLVLVAVLQVLDLMARADDVLAAAGNGTQDLWTYVLLKAPQIVDRFTPFAALLASMLTLAELSQHGEIIAMRAAGLGASRVMLPMALVGVMLCASHFIWREMVAAPCAQRLAAWEEAKFDQAAVGAPDFRTNAWVADGNSILKIAAIWRTGPRMEARGVTLYELGAAGDIKRIARLEGAVRNGGRWLSSRAEQIYPEPREAIRAASVQAAIDANEAVLFDAPPDLDTLNLQGLARDRDEAVRRGDATRDIEAIILHRFAAPAASIALPLLGAIVGFALPRRGDLLARLVVGLALGFGYFVADNLMISLGKMGAMPAFLAAWGPLIFVGLGSAYTLLKVEQPA